jgi:hypothetical protein
LDYLLEMLDPSSSLTSGAPRALFLLTVCGLLTALNLRGLQVRAARACSPMQRCTKLLCNGQLLS